MFFSCFISTFFIFKLNLYICSFHALSLHLFLSCFISTFFIFKLNLYIFPFHVLSLHFPFQTISAYFSHSCFFSTCSSFLYIFPYIIPIYLKYDVTILHYLFKYLKFDVKLFDYFFIHPLFSLIIFFIYIVTKLFGGNYFQQNIYPWNKIKRNQEQNPEFLTFL